MESSETAGEHSLTKLEIQLGLISEAFGESFGKQLFDDGTLDYLYVRGVILVRDAYLAEVARLLEEDDEPEERGQEFIPVEGLLPGVSLFSVGNRDVPRLAGQDRRKARRGRRDAGSHPVGHARSGPARPANRRACRSARCRTRAHARAAAAGAFIYVADTGLLEGAARRPSLARRGHRHRGPAARAGRGDHDPGLRGPRHVHRRSRPLHGARREGGGGQGLQQGRRDRRAPDRAPAPRGTCARPRTSSTCRRAGVRARTSRCWASRPSGTPTAIARAPCWSRRRATTQAAGRSGRRPSPRWWGSARSPRTAGPGPTSATTVPGWTCTPRARTWSTRTRPGPISTASRRMSARTTTSTGMAKWSGTSFSAPVVAGLIAARVTRDRRERAPGGQRAAGPGACAASPGVGPVLWPCDTGDCGDRLACCCGGKHAAARDCCC